MQALAVDVVSLYDFALPDARAIKLAATRDAARAREWNASFRWLFYGRTLPYVDRCELAPLHCSTAFKSIDGRWDGSSKSSSILLSPRYRAGVFTAWLHFEAKGSRSLDEVRTEIKNNEHLRLDSDVDQTLTGLNLAVGEYERHYCLVAVRTDATVDNFASVVADDRESAGRLFTGGGEHETLTFLNNLVDPKENLSHRIYERFFLRWTDALALYVNDVEKIPSYKDREYTLAVLPLRAPVSDLCDGAPHSPQPRRRHDDAERENAHRRKAWPTPVQRDSPGTRRILRRRARLQYRPAVSFCGGRDDGQGRIQEVRHLRVVRGHEKELHPAR